MATTTQPVAVEENRLHFSAVQSSVDFMALTERQQAFVLKYISGGMTTGQYDAGAAAMATYNPKDMKTARVMGWQMLNKQRIKKVLDLHFKRSPMDAILIALEKAIHRSLKKDGVPTIATAKAIAFYERAMRRLQPENATTDTISEGDDGIPKYAIGAVLEQDGKRYEVVAQEIV